MTPTVMMYMPWMLWDSSCAMAAGTIINAITNTAPPALKPAVIVTETTSMVR